MLACCCSSSSATRSAAAAAVFVSRPWTRRALTTNTLVATRSPQRHHHQPASTAARARAPVLSSTLAASRSFQHAARFSTSALRRAPAPQPFLLADIGEGIQEVEIIKFMAKEGDRVEEFDPICEVQSDKATVEITSRFTGTISSLTHKVGDIVKVGSPICFIQKDGADTAADAESLKATPQPQVKTPPTPAPETAPSAPKLEPVVNPSPSRPSFADLRPGQDILATPAVRRLSRDHTVDLAQVQGTGKDGRITKEDVQRHLDGGSGLPGSVRGGGTEQADADASREAVSSSSASAESVPLDPIRRAMFKAMSNTLQIPHFAYSEEIDVTALEGLRKTISRSLAASASKNTDQQGGPTKLTMLPLLVKALSLALHDHPLFLSTLVIPRVNPTNGSPTSPLEQANGAKLTRRTSHDISIALSSPQGLLTPLLRSVHSRSILDLAAQIADLQARAMVPAKQAGGGGLTPADFGGGGTITLSNIGAVGGGTYTHPLIPPTGQLAIGALGRTRAMPRFAGECPQDGLGELMSNSAGATVEGREDPDRILKRLIMPVSFTGDHRVVEGAEMARLVQRWKTLVEQPSLWFTMLK